MQVAPISLAGRAVRVEPLGLRHAPDLGAAIDHDSMRFLLDRPATSELAAVEAYIDRQLGDPGRVAFAIIDLAGARAVGSTSFMDIRSPHRGLEIGHTWISVRSRGTKINPETKYLLLRHAFETLGCIRVQLKTDARNAQSLRAMTKLGCTREGVLRRHLILPDGHVRDTVMFSVVDTDWPALSESLVARLGYRP